MKKCRKCGALFEARQCRECAKEAYRVWTISNPGRATINHALWYIKNKEIAKTVSASYRKTNKDKVREKRKKYRADNKDKIREQRKNYCAHNKDKIRARSAGRRAHKAKATPKWFSELDKFVFLEAVELAVRREKLTGIKWHVDHVVPLRGRYVCGLHVFNNFAVIPAGANRVKGNRF